MKFAIAWFDVVALPSTYAQYLADFNAMVTYWNTHYFNNPQYLKVNGRPVVMMTDLGGAAAAFSAQATGDTNALTQDTTFTAFMLAQARKVSGQDIYFVDLGANTGFTPGYDAYSAYGYLPGSPETYAQLANLYSEVIIGQEFFPRYRPRLIQRIIFRRSPRVGTPDLGWRLRFRLPISTVWTTIPSPFSVIYGTRRISLMPIPKKLMGWPQICCWDEFAKGKFSSQM